MSAPSNSGGGSRLSNESYPASDASDANTADSSHRPPELPTPAERIRDVLETYPERAMRPLSETHGRTLRADCLEEAETVEREIETGEHETATVSDTVSRPALTWIGGLARLLEKHESYRDKKLKLARGTETRGDYESFLVDMDMSYSQEAASRQYAQLQALERQFTGGEYPDGSECEAEYAVPVTVMFSLSVSSLEAGEYRPPVDHDREGREAWSGSTDSVKRVLRDVLERKCGLEPGDYAWHYQSEPHAGGGDASGYCHAHPFVILDMAEAGGEADPTDPETYRPVVDKHVELCEHAEHSAHKIDESDESAVSVNEPDDIDEVASYISKYLAVGPDQDLLERSPEYLMYAASQFASSTQKYSRSRWATAAIKADKCQQQYLSEESDQSHEHGESVVRSSRPGLEFECAECGSPHGIDQSADSLARFRLNQTETAATAATATRAVTDGGVSASGHESGESGRTLAERWPSARSAGSVGSEAVERPSDRESPGTALDRREVPLGGGYSYCSACGEREPAGACEATAYQSAEYEGRCPLPPEHFGEHTIVEKSGKNASETCTVPSESYRGDGWVPFVFESEPNPERESEGFDRPPEWRPESVVQTASGEETEIGSPGGVEYGQVMFREDRKEVLGLECSLCGVYVFRPDHPEPDSKHFAFHLKSEHKAEIEPGAAYDEYVVDDEESESEPSGGEEVAEPERESGGDGDVGLASEVSRSIEELVRTEGVTSIPSVLGRLGIDPEWREEVADVLEECR